MKHTAPNQITNEWKCYCHDNHADNTAWAICANVNSIITISN